ncbi:MAG: copper resistance protein CopC [Actinomycetota bacterium]|nr:copper resistance protein CopC [Actinomycetota bacterium]
MRAHRRVLMRCGVVAAVAAVLVVAVATPAFAHATLQETSPAPGQVLDSAPKEITLGFNEPVEVSIGALRVYNSRGERLDIGGVSHPGGDQSRVRVTAPKLDKDSYVVTWRVISADSHPVSGAFTFQVGSGAPAGNLQSLTERLLANQGGDNTVGFLYAVARFAVFASLALLIGAAAFLVLIWPSGRESKGAARLVWAGWIGAFVATAAGIALDGAYAAALPLGDAFKPSVIGDVLDTRFGRVWLLRLVLLVLALPLLRLLVNRRPVIEYPLPRWWRPAAAVIGAGLVLTPGLSGHAGTGDLVPFALLADAMHISGVSLWLGGLIVLVAVVLRRRNIEELRSVVPRFSRLALAAVCFIVATGAFQAWRQLGSISNFRDTDYGKLLAAKLLAFGALIITAAFSREIVNRRFIASRPAPTSAPPSRVPVTAGGPPLSSGDDLGGRNGGDGGNGGDDVGADDDMDEAEIDEWEARNLRRHVGLEVVIAVIILSIASLLVNAAPAVSVNESGASGVTLRSEAIAVDVTAIPGRPGRNELHFTAFSPQGGPLALPQVGGLEQVGEFQASASLTQRDIAPIPIPVRRAGPGHYIASGISLPIPGDWTLTIRALVSETDEAAVAGKISIR